MCSYILYLELSNPMMDSQDTKWGMAQNEYDYYFWNNTSLDSSFTYQESGMLITFDAFLI